MPGVAVRDNPYAQFIGGPKEEAEAPGMPGVAVRDNPYAQFMDAGETAAAQKSSVRDNPYAEFMNAAQGPSTAVSSSRASENGDMIGPEMGAQRPPPGAYENAYGEGGGGADAIAGAGPPAPMVPTRPAPKVVKVDRALAAFVPHALRRNRQPPSSKKKPAVSAADTTTTAPAPAPAKRSGDADSSVQQSQPVAKRAKVVSAAPTVRSAAAQPIKDVGGAFDEFMSEINSLGCDADA